ncbi:helix-turn-helix domain-containing protein [Salmonella enterica subsp. enterica serovar Newport]|uniref:HTH cro/C1-type domain-containing protein n=1 Tax=Salmonella newport TaxID=108619 RepID=A0A5U9KW59_SALNE|nr:hypothetical protein [Salmonella enterica subsp. enterica serovar Newport]ECN8540846.1 helix-turn-helix domain-containing protein [Salmonella enterica subsp. enterica serovar Newport]EJH8885161.1 helix-turn-helix domain-containing protein [Salmonella enterica]
MKKQYHPIPSPNVNDLECVSFLDPSAKAGTLLQGIKYHANKILDAFNNDSEIANHTACIIDLTELCIWLVNINTSSLKNIHNNKKMGLPPVHQPTAPTDYIPYNIGNRIQIARENLDMSEDDLAEKLNIHPGDVLAWEDSTDQLPAEMIIPLANALKCDPMWLLTGESSNRQISADSGK